MKSMTPRYQKLTQSIRHFVFAGATLLWVAAGAKAQEQPISIPLVNLWDLTGTYEAEANGMPFTFDLVQDAKGKLTGGSNWQYEDGEGNRLNANLAIKGHITSQAAGRVAVKLSFVHQGLVRAGESGEPQKFRATQRFLAYLDPETQTVSGRLITVAKTGTRPAETSQTNYDMVLDPVMDGTADLVIDVTKHIKLFTGIATCTMANGQAVNLDARGRVIEAPGILRILMHGHQRYGSAGAMFKVDLDAEDTSTVLFLQGRIMGQKVSMTSLAPAPTDT